MPHEKMPAADVTREPARYDPRGGKGEKKRGTYTAYLPLEEVGSAPDKQEETGI